MRGMGCTPSDCPPPNGGCSSRRYNPLLGQQCTNSRDCTASSTSSSQSRPKSRCERWPWSVTRFPAIRRVGCHNLGCRGARGYAGSASDGGTFQQDTQFASKATTLLQTVAACLQPQAREVGLVDCVDRRRAAGLGSHRRSKHDHEAPRHGLHVEARIGQVERLREPFAQTALVE